MRLFTSGPVVPQLLRFAAPFAAANLLQVAYNLVDIFFVGKFAGAVGLAAVSIGGEIIHFCTFIGQGLICNAGQVLVSQYTGLQDRKSLSKVSGNLFVFSLIFALGLTVLSLLCNPFLVDILNVPAEAKADCIGYTGCICAALCFTYGYQAISAIMRGSGDSRHPMIFIAITAGLNVVLDYLFLSRGMGAFGAGLATAISQLVCFVCSVWYLFTHGEAYRLDIDRSFFRLESKMLRKILSLGFPMMLQSTAVSVSNLFVSSLVNRYGVVAAAVTGVGSKIATIASVVTVALSAAGSTVVGQNCVVKKFDRIRSVLGAALLFSGGFALVLSLVMILRPEALFSIFSDDPDVLAMSHTYVAAGVLGFFGFALRSPAIALCNGIGYARMNLILGILDGLVLRIGLTYLLGEVLGFGLQGFWIGSAVASMTFFFVMFPYYLSGRWKKRTPPALRG